VLSKSSPQSTTPNREVKAIDEDKHDPKLAKRLHILHLPPETLLQIALNLCGTNAILALSKTNKYIHRITNEAMAKKLVVRPPHMKGPLDWLAHHPHIMGCVNTVDVSAFQQMHDTHETGANVSALSVSDFSSDVSRVLRIKIWANTGRTAGKETWLSGFQVDNDSIWGDRHQVCVDVLFSICPNIRALKLSMPAAKLFDKNPANIFLNPPSSMLLPMPNPAFEPATPLQGVSLQLARENLRSLTIAPGRRWTGLPQLEFLLTSSHIYWRGMGKHVITLHGFDKLEHLDVPMASLGLPQTIRFQAYDERQIPTVRLKITYPQTTGPVFKKGVEFLAKVLPLSLRSVQLRSCNEKSFGFLRRFSEVPAESHLKHVELYLDSCARSTILSCLEASSHVPDLLVRLGKLERMGIVVKFYTETDETLIDMKQELTIMQYLNLEEVGLITLAGRQFSDLNLAAILQRQSSRLAKRIFTRHALAHFDLLNSPTFQAKYWLGSAFFHGAKNTKYDPDLGYNSTAPLATAPPGAHTMRKHHNNHMLDLDNYKFTLQVYLTPRSDLSTDKKVWLLGKTDLLYSLWFPARKCAVKKLVRNQRKETKISKKVETKHYGPTDSLELPRENTAKHTKVLQPSVYLKAAVEQCKGSSLTIDGVSWLHVDWESHLQPTAHVFGNTRT
jgi:hypothetical protein